MPMRRGYTLIEVLVVVVVLGIVAAIVVPQMLQAGTLGVQAAARMIIADILYAQNDAVAHQAERRVVFDVEGNRYMVTDASGETLSTPWRGSGDRFVVDFSRDKRFAGVRLTEVDFADETTLAFDEMGGEAGDNPSGGHIIIEFNEERFRIEVAPYTARVTISKL
ncbi:Tfp pilus assembly protein FimT/FimU [Phycisphaerales bacterium AB-hyl4]|uniref:Tfp pilus assembly protein FimT/FimU n=1 Tax=Natronomicrosphaera hydrolytica TaxID=3242702 RepID=A0ABV4U9B8_9BACT